MTMLLGIATFLIPAAAATTWFRSLRRNSASDYKANKTFRLGQDKEHIRRQINPLFVVVQVAALNSSVSGGVD